MKIFWLFLIIFLHINIAAFSQTKVNNRFNGRVTQIQDSIIYFKMNKETLITFDESEIEKIAVHKIGFLRKEVNGQPVLRKQKEFLDDDYILAQTRLFASQTGFGLKKGEVEYRAIQVFINEMSYGITDNITIGAGIYPVLISNVVTFKANFNKDIGDFIHLSVGGQLFTSIGGFWDVDNGGEGAFTTFAAASIGSSTHFINVAYNRWTGFDGFDKGDVFSLGGSFKLNRKFRLFADCFFVFDDSRNREFFFDQPDRESQPSLIGGMSWFNKFHKIDFGIAVAPNNGNETLLLPIIGYVRRF